MLGLIVTFIVVVVAHIPAVGVKVYVVVPEVDVFMADGLHVPVIPLFDVVGKTPGLAPTQYGPKVVKVGVILGFTTTVIVVAVAHNPDVGVKV
jgi:hypothetical protein